ncbi:MAG: FAD-dependent oxidoreductase [Thermoanaerobaculia bacterium]
MTAAAGKRVAVVGGGPSGMTAALLLARAGHRVAILERERELGGLWAARFDADGYFAGENSCKVYQPTYRSAPALLRLIGTRWETHFVARHDLRRQWMTPFIADSSWRDLGKLGGAFLLHLTGLRSYREVSVAQFLVAHRIGEGCRAWMRATALGGITGTLNMTMWELFHRLGANLGSLFLGRRHLLQWNARPPSSPDGFLTAWRRALDAVGVEVRTGTEVVALAGGVEVETAGRGKESYDAVFLAVPPRALARLLAGSPELAGSFGPPADALPTVLRESVYEHFGLTWTFASEFPRDLPLGGHNVRRGWHPILVQYSQYREFLRPPAVTCVIASVSLDTDFRHPRLGTRARDHAPEQLARILWEDERRVDPTLPEPLATLPYGLSNATQIVRHGPLAIRSSRAEVYLATSLNGRAPYFTASLESAIQAGNAAALAFDPNVERLPA